MKNILVPFGMFLLASTISSYVVEEKEKVYVEPAPVVEEKVIVEHPYHHHHHDVEVEIK